MPGIEILNFLEPISHQSRHSKPLLLLFYRFGFSYITWLLSFCLEADYELYFRQLLDWFPTCQNPNHRLKRCFSSHISLCPYILDYEPKITLVMILYQIFRIHMNRIVSTFRKQMLILEWTFGQMIKQRTFRHDMLRNVWTIDCLYLAFYLWSDHSELLIILYKTNILRFFFDEDVFWL